MRALFALHPQLAKEFVPVTGEASFSSVMGSPDRLLESHPGACLAELVLQMFMCVLWTTSLG